MEDKKYNLRFEVRKSVRYHDYRRSFYLKAHSWVSFWSIVLGSAAVAAALRESDWEWLRWAAPAAIAILAAYDLVAATANKAALHTMLYRRFIQLEKKTLNPELDLGELEMERLDIEADEPPPLQALIRACHNEVLRSEGRPELFEPLRWYHQALKYFLTFNDLPLRKGAAKAP